MPSSKGTAKRKSVDVSGKLKTCGYRPIDKQYFRQARDLPLFTHATVRAMLMDPGVRLNLRMREAPLAAAQIGYKQGDKFVEGVQCEDQAIGKWIYRQLQRIWKTYLPQITKAQTWGWSAGEITMRLSDAGLVEIDKLEARHAGDCRLLMLDRQKWGVRFNRIEDQGYVSLPFPYCWFHSYDADEGEVYGTPNLLGAYSAWADKWFNGGGLDTRRLFMHKDAYGGRKLYYPEGTTFLDGVDTPNEQIARRIVEQLATGGVATLPSTRDPDTGQRLWEIEEPNTTSGADHILQYPKDLDDEIRHGQEIPDDVINSGEAGGWAGKRIPMAAFYGSLDHEVVSILCDLKEQVLDPLIMINWGCKVSYSLEHKPLAEQAMEQQANAGPGTDTNPFMPGVQRADPYQMSLTSGFDPVEAVGQGVLSVGDMCAAAKRVLTMSTFVESEHNRDANGQFAETDSRKAFSVERRKKDGSNSMETQVFEKGERVDVYFPGGKHVRGNIVQVNKDGVLVDHGSFKMTYPQGSIYKAGTLLAKESEPKAKKRKSMKAVIDEVNDKFGEGLTDADRVPDAFR